MSIKNTQLDIKKILERVGSVIGSYKNIDIGPALGASPQTVANWKKRNAVPWPELFNFGMDRNLDMNWLFTGDYAPQRAGPVGVAQPAGPCQACVRKDSFIDKQGEMIDRLTEEISRYRHDLGEQRPAAHRQEGPECAPRAGNHP